MAERVAVPPARPRMLFDGDCGFCRFWVERWRARLAGLVDFAPYQERGSDFPEISDGDFRRAVHLVLPDGTVFRGAHAVFRALALRPRGGGAGLAAYRSLPGFAAVAEAGYAWIAAHRNVAGKLTTAIWGRDPSPPTWLRSRWLFLRALGAIFFGAFLSLRVQIDGLIGSRGILPAGDFLRYASAQLGGTALRLLPSILWLTGAGDGALHALCAAGMAFSLLLFVDVAPAISAFACWALYLSLTVVGQDFLSFQWDILLIETGFLAIFLTDPRRILRGSGRGAPPPAPIAVFLVRLLLFRLMLSSGVVKLASGDAAWRGMTALRYHFETQPLPTRLGWWAHQTGAGLLATATVVLFAIEIVVPFFLFAPRRPRNGAVAAIVFLQIAIGLTGNYAFFNLLTVALCILSLDDRTLRVHSAPGPSRERSGWPRPVLAIVATVIVFAGAVRLAEIFLPRFRATAVAGSLLSPVEPFRTVNGYGLFAVMTTTRPEIIMEGSRDGEAWIPYDFRWKPGDVRQPPRFVEPHQPRLDWQMWFAALSDVRQNVWFVEFVRRLLEGSPPVLRLLRGDPFGGDPPRFVRAELYDYRFTDLATRRRTGAWWTRRAIGEYLPPVTLSDFRANP